MSQFKAFLFTNCLDIDKVFLNSNKIKKKDCSFNFWITFFLQVLLKISTTFILFLSRLILSVYWKSDIWQHDILIFTPFNILFILQHSLRARKSSIETNIKNWGASQNINVSLWELTSFLSRVGLKFPCISAKFVELGRIFNE